MKFLRFCAGLPAAALFALVLAAPGSTLADELVIVVTGINPDKGSVRFGLYRDAKRFPKKGGTIAGGSAQVRNGEVRYVFRDLEPGQYAVALFHDANGNGRFDTTMLGLPDEGYAFSNGARATFSAPSFERAAVTVLGRTTIRISITY